MSRHTSQKVVTWDLFAPSPLDDGLRSITLLATQLAAVQNQRVRLFIDDPGRLSPLSARIDPTLWVQPQADFDLLRLRLADGVATADHVVSLHRTQLPSRYRERMAYGAANRCKQFRIWPTGTPQESFQEAARLSTCATVEIDVVQDEAPLSMGLIKDTRNIAELRARWKVHPHLIQTTLENMGLPGDLSKDTLIIGCWDASLADMQAFISTVAQTCSPQRVLLLLGPGAGSLPRSLSEGVVTCLHLPALSWSQLDELVWSCDLLFCGQRDLALRAMESGTPLLWLPPVSNGSSENDDLQDWYYHGVDPGFKRRLLVAAHILREQPDAHQELAWYLKQREDLAQIASEVALRIAQAPSLADHLPHLSPDRLEQARRKKQQQGNAHPPTWPMNLSD